MMQGYFAYRLPDSTQVRFLKTEFVRVKQAVIPASNEIVIHSFLGDEIYLLKNSEEIDQDAIQLKLKASDKETIWSKNEYLEAFEKVQVELNSGRFQKLVLSRIKEVQTQKSAVEIFQHLNQTYLNTFNFLFSSELTGTWIGASPELLLKSEKHSVSTVSLAGTKPSDEFSEWTPKEKEEQKFVTDFILEAFRKNEVSDRVVSETYTVKAGPVDHLKTDISGQIKESSQIQLLLNDLHPTPATCGIPKTASMKKIVEIEAHKRKFYTGHIGVDFEGVQYFFVNLRCMELQKERALLFLGGGITQSSIGEREWLETERKATTLMRVL